MSLLLGTVGATARLASLSIAVTTSSDAFAQSTGAGGAVEQARGAYETGARAFAEKRFADAARHFDEAAALAPNAVALVTGALAWERAGQTVHAADDYARALSVPGLDEKQSLKAKQRLTALELQLGAVHVAGPAGTQVKIDDDGSSASVPATLHASAGVHVLVFRPPEGAPTPNSIERRTITLSAGEGTEIDLTPPSRSAVASAEAARDSASMTRAAAARTRRTAGYALIGTGAASEIVAAALWWGPAQGAADDYRRSRTQDNRDAAAGLERWTNIALVGGGALVAAGALCIFWPWGRPQDAASPRSIPILGVGPTSVRIGGEW